MSIYLIFRPCLSHFKHVSEGSKVAKFPGKELGLALTMIASALAGCDDNEIQIVSCFGLFLHLSVTKIPRFCKSNFLNAGSSHVSTRSIRFLKSFLTSGHLIFNGVICSSAWLQG